MQVIDLIFQQYYRPLCLYATHYLHDIDEADDQAQESSFREAKLWTAIELLPERCREIFLMSKRDGMTYRVVLLRHCFQWQSARKESRYEDAYRLPLP